MNYRITIVGFRQNTSLSQLLFTISRYTDYQLPEIEQHIKKLPWSFSVEDHQAQALKQSLQSLGVAVQLTAETLRPSPKSEPKEDLTKKQIPFYKKKGVIPFSLIATITGIALLYLLPTSANKSQKSQRSQVKTTPVRTLPKSTKLAFSNDVWGESVKRLQNYPHASLPNPLQKELKQNLGHQAQTYENDTLWVTTTSETQEIFSIKAKRFLQRARKHFPKRPIFVIEPNKGWIQGS